MVAIAAPGDTPAAHGANKDVVRTGVTRIMTVATMNVRGPAHTGETAVAVAGGAAVAVATAAAGAPRGTVSVVAATVVATETRGAGAIRATTAASVNSPPSRGRRKKKRNRIRRRTCIITKT